jgi:hypothetical protein
MVEFGISGAEPSGCAIMILVIYLLSWPRELIIQNIDQIISYVNSNMKGIFINVWKFLKCSNTLLTVMSYTLYYVNDAVLRNFSCNFSQWPLTSLQAEEPLCWGS